jgi:hypothetical protein
MEQDKSPFLRLVGIALVLTMLISLIVLGFGLIKQWDQPVEFSNGFFIAGAIVIVLGVFSVAGGFAQRANFPIVYAETATQASLSERTQRMMADINQRYGLIVLFGAVGILLIAISIAIGVWL